MSPLKTSIIAAVLSAALTGGMFHHLQKKKAREASHLRDENNRMRYEAYANQAARRTPSDKTKNTLQNFSTAPKTPDAASVENYHNAGQSTAVAALQTFAWACDRGDVETVRHMLHFDPTARTKAETFLASVPEEARRRWQSVDDMAAAELTYAVMQSPFPNADILQAVPFKAISDERTEFRLPGTRRDRSTFQKIGDVWKYVITETMVDAYIQRSAQQAER